MAARFPLPNGSVLEIASVLGAAVDFTALTNAAPPVATSVGHSIENGDVLLLSSGWARITDRAVLAASVVADTFALKGLDTTDTDVYTPGAGLGSVMPVTAWAQISKVTAFAVSGGEQQYLTVGYLEDDDDRQMPTNRNPLSISITVEDQPAAGYVSVIEKLGDTKSLGVATGLDYAAIPAAAAMLGIKRRDLMGVFPDLRIMEHEALGVMAEAME
ncbi:phage tail tube protein [Pseudomonas sichuanensis]|uniref:phage tail tube protein n=1 Tax=Pseudomonas TaxID=286 RepID=UPI0036E71C7F